MKRKSLKQLKYLSLTFIFLTLVFVSSFIFVSCDKDSETKIKLYNTQTESIEKIDIESYLEGVVAGEINNDAPIEALKAQAVMARTFTYKFLESSTSKYEGADISTDITEAQAYAKDKINDKIKKAVKETNGQTVKYEGEYINAYFHSNSGGKTALLKDGFSLSSENLPYLKSVKTGEINSNSNNYSWSYTFSKDEILNALRNMGASVSNVSSFKKGEVSESGRCLTLIIGGKEISAATFRLNIGSTKMRSTLITDIVVTSSSVTISGLGYGHGVGLSQEYAIILANEGKTYKEIINYFFNGVEID